MEEDNEINTLKSEITQLKLQLRIKEKLLLEKNKKNDVAYNDELRTDEIVRYSRQMIVPSINASGQLLLKNSKVLIIGLGGLGCPAAIYLAAAGIGEMTLVDYDDVELSNLHRQILHTERSLGLSKVMSAYNALININSTIKINPINVQVNSTTMSDILAATKFNAVLDCSDNTPTRYLLNDMCVLKEIPLISGSALQMDGQLTVYNYGGGPCYRCLFPDPPPNETVKNCEDAGVLGAVPGVIGVLQALETIKILLHSNQTLSQKYLVFDASDTSFKRLNLRPRNHNCKICGENPTIKNLIDYEQFCKSKISDKVENISILTSSQHIDIQQFSKTKNDNLVIDVRPEIEFKMCKLPESINFPYSNFIKMVNIDYLKQMLKQHLSNNEMKVYVLCRRGNDSQRSINHMEKLFPEYTFLNVTGGLYAYAKNVDPEFPIY